MRNPLLLTKQKNTLRAARVGTVCKKGPNRRASAGRKCKIVPSARPERWRVMSGPRLRKKHGTSQAGRGLVRGRAKAQGGLDLCRHTQYRSFKNQKKIKGGGGSGGVCRSEFELSRTSSHFGRIHAFPEFTPYFTLKCSFKLTCFVNSLGHPHISDEFTHDLTCVLRT